MEALMSRKAEHMFRPEKKHRNCLTCGTLHRLRYHACCWIWKVALIIPAIHIVLHLLGLPHPEVLSFIP